MTRGGKRPGAGQPRKFDDPRRITVVWEADDDAKFRALAEAKGLSPSALARHWLLSRLARFGDKPRR